MSDAFIEYSCGELVETVTDKVNMQDDNTYPLASIRRRNGGFFHRETLLGKQILTKTLTKAIPDSFVISKMQVVHGACSYIPTEFEDLFLSASYVSLLPKKPARINTKYLHYYSHLWQSYKAFLRSSHGVHIEKMTFDIKDWLKSKVSIPPLPEQEKIAAILTSVDEVIEKGQAQIDKLQDLKKATMNQLLTRGINHTEFKGSPLGKIPKDWDFKKVGDFFEVIDPQPDHRTPAVSVDGVPYIGMGDLQVDGKIDFTNARKVSFEALNKQIKGFSVGELAFVIGKIGTIGNPFWVPVKRNYCLSANIILFTGANPTLQKYLFLLFSSDIMASQIANNTNTTSQPALGIKKVRDLNLPIPPNDELEIIVNTLSSIDKNIEHKQRKLEQTKALKKSLMQDLLTGKKRVKVG